MRNKADKHQFGNESRSGLLQAYPPDDTGICNSWQAPQRKNSSGVTDGLRAKVMIALLMTCTMLISVTNASEVKILQALISMQGSNKVSERHDIQIIIYRDQFAFPQTLWNEDACFKLRFGSPYTIKPDSWKPWDWESGDNNKPRSAIASTQLLVNGVNSYQVPDQEYELNFNFVGIDDPKLTQIAFDISNFNNPWSTIDLNSIFIDSFDNKNCEGAVQSQTAVDGVEFYPERIQEKASSSGGGGVTITSSSTVLGATQFLFTDGALSYQKNNAVIFKFSPKTFMTKDGSGSLNINIPAWYDVGGLAPMMFDTNYQNSCESPDMTVDSSNADDIKSSIFIRYSGMPEDKWTGKEITVECAGFLNPITPKVWSGFSITTYDGERQPNQIDSTELDPALMKIGIDTSLYTPAIIAQSGLSINPSVFQVQNVATWYLSIVKFPIPVEQYCFIEFTIPSDLQYVEQVTQGTGMFASPTGPSVIPDITNDLPNDPSDPASTPGRTRLRFVGCQSESTVGPSPSGRLTLATISTPLAKKDTGQFYFTVYKDSLYQLKIAEFEIGKGIYVPGGELVQGSIGEITVVPADPYVQVITDITITFTMEHTLNSPGSIVIKFPASITLPDGKTPNSRTVDLVIRTVVVVVYVDPTTSREIKLIIEGNVNLVERTITVIDPFQGDAPQPISNELEDKKLTISITFKDLTNPVANFEAGGVVITTYYEETYIVDTGFTTTSFVPEPNTIQGNEVIVLPPITSGTESEYKLVFTPSSMVPGKGYIYIKVPIQLVMDPDTVLSGGICREPGFICECVVNDDLGTGESDPLNPSYGVIIVHLDNTVTVPAKQEITIVIIGIVNPRSFTPTNQFIIFTYDQDKYLIDREGFNIIAVMTELATTKQIQVIPSNTVNGVKNTYTISITTNIAMVDGDYWVIEFPPEVKLPDNLVDLDLTPISRTKSGVSYTDTIEAAIAGQTLTIIYSKIAFISATYQFTISNVQNPGSTKPSTPFGTIISFDINNRKVQHWVPSATSFIIITNIFPAELRFENGLYASLAQRNRDPNNPTLYIIRFTPTNPIPEGGVFQIDWPLQVHIPSSVGCTNILDKPASLAKCDIPEVDQKLGGTITVTLAFTGVPATGFNQEITIQLDGVINPANNDPESLGRGFVIRTYTDATLAYQIDYLPDGILVPSLYCAYPCRTCQESNGGDCDACYIDSVVIDGRVTWEPDFRYFFRNAAGRGQCLTACPAGYTRDNESGYLCIKCDSPCGTCKDEDKFYCLTCHPLYPYRLIDGTGKCLSDCGVGFYETGTIGSEQTCGRCEWPCKNCDGTKDFCTDCYEPLELPVTIGAITYGSEAKDWRPARYQNKCGSACPAGHTLIDGVCLPCASPCATCNGLTTFCLTCDGSDGRVLLAKDLGACFTQCPINMTPVAVEGNDSKICVRCPDPACDLCDSVDTRICLRCAKGLYVHEERCIPACPDGWKTNGDGTACVPFTMSDIACLPFPFLLTALILCLIACCGKCKKKKVRNTYVSTQNTITCFIVIIAFVQFFAIIALGIWAYLFEMHMLFWAVCGLFGCLVVLNMVFQILFTCTFNRKVTPKDSLRRYKEGRLTKAELKRFVVPSDEGFFRYQLKHRCFSCFIAMFTCCCTFKCNKAYYSHFYSFGIFKARWSQGRYYRKVMTAFTIAEMLVDACLLVVCVLAQLESGVGVFCNMLWITLIEVAVLSLLLFLLCCIELWKLKEYLRYNEKRGQVKVRFDVSSANEDLFQRADRKVAMAGLLQKVKTNQDIFLNNKLDDLLFQFGDRRCKSMVELPTGWDKEDDPRQNITWPLSPTKQGEYQGEYHWTRDDLIGHEDNVYAEARVKDPGAEVAVQGDQEGQEFMLQLGRKQGDLLAGAIREEDELDQRKAGQRGARGGRRRGRTNKYNKEIDAEDDEEADQKEESVTEIDPAAEEERLALIRMEQEEEEAQMRLTVEEQRVKQELWQSERRAKQAEAERERREADAAAEIARQEAAAEEERRRLEQERIEVETRQEFELTRVRLAQEEAEAQRRLEADEESRKRELAAMNETNRATYEAEEAARVKTLNEEHALRKSAADATELQAQARQTLLNQRKVEEAQRMQAERDEEELRLRKLMLDAEERQREAEKEAARLRLEREGDERKLLALETAEEKRAAKLAADRQKLDDAEGERQRRIKEEEVARAEAIRLEDEKRIKRIQEDEERRRKLDEDERLHRERMQRDETDRRAALEQEEAERLGRLRREEDRAKERLDHQETERKSQIAEVETLRLQQLHHEETLRLERIRAEEERRFEAIRLEEEKRLQSIEAAVDARRRQEDDERRAKREEDEKRAREEEDRILREKAEIEEERARLAALKAQHDKELADLRKREEEHALKELRETEERIEAERLEREALDREKAELARRQALADEQLLAQRDELERARLLKEAEALELAERLRKERADFEEEKRRTGIEAAEAKRKQAEETELAKHARVEMDAKHARVEMDWQRKLAVEDQAVKAAAPLSPVAQPAPVAAPRAEKVISKPEEAYKGVEVISEKEEEDVLMNTETLQAFSRQEVVVDVEPPNADLRTFNVNDILGELDRDDRGNIQVLSDAQGNDIDKTGHPVNAKGYLKDPRTGDILDSATKQTLFPNRAMDDKGEVPAPFSIEKFNFNPHQLLGDLEFQYDSRTGRAIPQLLQTKQGYYIDKKGRRVNRFGWLVQGGNGHIVDKNGKKKFDRKQLDDGDVPKLLNYGGKRFDIKEVIGAFDKDPTSGNIIFKTAPDGTLTDNVGRPVNERGYLVDQDGDILDRKGKVIFLKAHLKDGEFPKLFLFTKFNIDNITGDFEMSPLAEPILDQDKDGNFVDRKGRLVNPRGYLIDPEGNIIDQRGYPVFDKVVLSPEGEIPKIFRMQILKTDSGSSLSRLMDEIEKNQPSDYEPVEEEKEPAEGQDGDTSVDSAMGDTPANYNRENQRFDQDYDQDEYGDEYEDYEAIPEEPHGPQRDATMRQSKSKKPRRRQRQPPPQLEADFDPLPKRKTKRMGKKKKKNGGYVEYLMPTKNEMRTADAYGGQPKGQFRIPGVKYHEERLQNRIKTTADIPGGLSQLEHLAVTVAHQRFDEGPVIGVTGDHYEARSGRPDRLSRPYRVSKNQLMIDPEGISQMGSISQRKNHTSKAGSKLRQSQTNLDEIRARRDRTRQNRIDDMNDEGDFEKMFGKDIDQYLEGSDDDDDDFKMEDNNISGQYSGRGMAEQEQRRRSAQGNNKLRSMEMQYLKRVESNQGDLNANKNKKIRTQAISAMNLAGKRTHSQKPKLPAPREFQDRFVDNPDFIHRGEMLEFETQKLARTQQKKRNATQQERTKFIGGVSAAAASNFEHQSRQRQ